MDDPTALLEIAQKAQEPEKKVLGPNDAQPTTNADKSPLVTLPMTPEEVGQFWEEVEKADTRIAQRSISWDVLLKEYQPIVKASGTPEALKVNVHFRNVHTKLPQMFFRNPDLICTPEDPSPANDTMPNPMQRFAPVDPMTGQQVQLPPLTREDVIAVKQAVLNKTLGRTGIKAHRLMDELLFDVLAWSGIAACKIGYRCAFATIQEPVMQPDPNYIPPQQPGMVLGLQPQAPPPQVPVTDPMTGQPQMKSTKVPIYEEYYARRVPPKKLIVDSNLHSGRVDEDATLTGMHFYLTPKRAISEFGVTEDELGVGSSDEKLARYEADGNAKAEKLVHCVELWVRASAYTDEPHPLAINQLVLIEGIKDRPVVWRPSPDQEFDERHQLTKDSLLGFPIQLLSIRDLADSPFPEADSAFTNSQAKELNTYRRQGVKLRDAAIGKYLYDADAFDDETDIPTLLESEIAFIAVKAGLLKDGAKSILDTTAKVQGTPDDYRNQAGIAQEMKETLGISSDAAGNPEATIRTATETAAVSQGMQGRNGKERDRVLDFYLELARKVDQLLMRYMDQEHYIQIVGVEGANRIMMWNKDVIAGTYLYDISPDSQMGPDSALDYKNTLELYNLAAPDPLFNRAYVLRRLARMKGMDPAKVVLSPQNVPVQPPHGGGPVNEHYNSNSGGKPNAPGAPNRREQPA